jgi:hypothetical protein
LQSGLNASEEVAAANYPDIRVFTVGQGTTSATPLTQLGSVAQGWTPATPASIGAGNWSEFSAARHTMEGLMARHPQTRSLACAGGLVHGERYL